jgi:phenylpropionate dioxygenase-like ring-hydroxylating dioxygenase large terminal subunit
LDRNDGGRPVSSFTDTEVTEEHPRLLAQLDGRRYTAPERYAAELHTAFAAGWLMAARLDELPSPGALDRIVAGRPLALTRDRDTVRALHNVCSHRGCAVAQGSVEGSTLRCPYHGWTYALDGSVVVVPGEHRFERLNTGDCSIPGVASQVWDGAVWVSFAEHPGSVAEWLGPWKEELERYEMNAQRTVAYRIDVVELDWKACVDAFIETYHVPFIHGATVGKIVQGRASRFRYGGPHSRMVIPVRRPGKGEGPKDLLREQRHDHVNYHLFPNLVLDLLATWGIVLSFEPLGSRSTEIRTWMLADPGAPDDRLATQWEQFGRVMDEDVQTLERTALGMASPMFRTVRLGGEEERLVHFHRHVDELMSGV